MPKVLVDLEDFISPQRAAELVGTSRSRIYFNTGDGKELPQWIIGGHRYTSREAVIEWGKRKGLLDGEGKPLPSSKGTRKRIPLRPPSRKRRT